MTIQKLNRKMQHFIFITALLSAILFQDVLCADEAAQLESEADRISYSLGQQIGRDFKRQGVDLDAAALVHGFNDANGGVEPALDQEEMNTTLGRLKGRISAGQREEVQERWARKQRETEEKRSQGKEFLAENRSKPGVKTLPSGMQYKVIKSGAGKKPGPQDVVRVHYRARMINGHEYDSSYSDKDPVSFSVSKVIPGWTEALQLMREGARWELYLPPELAYGKRGPLADQTVIYEIELLGVGEDSQSTGPQTVSNGKTQ